MQLFISEYTTNKKIIDIFLLLKMIFISIELTI